MAAEVLLEINGHKYNALGFSYEFYQVPDFKGKPVTGIKGGDIHVVLESSYDNSILETMLSDKTRKVSYVPWEEYEPCPVSGRIQFVQDDVHVFRELAFEEAYITRYKEKMDANGYPMSILLTISTLRLDINKFVRMDRRPETTYGFGWVRFKEKVKSTIVVKDSQQLINILGQLISLEFKIFDNGELRHAQCSGFMNKDRIMVVENFKFD